MIYNTKDNTTSHHTPVHHGNEAAAYLQFIVEYYDCLPSYMVFIHAHRLDAEANKVTSMLPCGVYRLLLRCGSAYICWLKLLPTVLPRSMHKLVF